MEINPLIEPSLASQGPLLVCLLKSGDRVEVGDSGPCSLSSNFGFLDPASVFEKQAAHHIVSPEQLWNSPGKGC